MHDVFLVIYLFSRMCATLRRLVDGMVSHAGSRKAYDRRLAEFDLVKSRLAQVLSFPT